MDISTFEWQLSFLTKHFNIVSSDALRQMKEGKGLSKSSVLITFDDGYADNYVYAYPLLKKYSAKAILFIPTSKITNGDKRNTLEDYYKGNVKFSQLFIPDRKERALEESLQGETKEFLRWSEIEEMISSGVFEVGSHGHIHSKVFDSDNVVGIYGLNNVHWSFLYANENKAEYGMPIFHMKSSLACKRFYPYDKFRRYAITMYEKNRNVNRLIEKLNLYKEKGRYEIEFEDRIKHELETSKELIESNLGRGTTLLSWPWGEYTEAGIDIARSLGFEFCFTTKKRACFGNDFCRIGRIKAPENKSRFLRKIFLNSNTLTAKIYSKAH